MLKSNACRFLCKLNVEKLYDHVNLNFSILALKKMSFSGKWVRWIKWYISSARFSVIVNDTLLVSLKGTGA